MERSVRKKQLMISAAGGFLVLALSAAHYASPFARRLAAGKDVELVLLSGVRPALFVYRPASRTVRSIRLPGGTFSGAKKGASARQRAWEALKLLPGTEERAREAPAYIELEYPDLDRFEDLLNGWRSRPARLLSVFRFLRDLDRHEAAGLSSYETLLAVLELARVNSSNFVKEELDKGDPVRTAVWGRSPAGRSAARSTVRLEVLNASGKDLLASRVTRFLRDAGFDVISFGNYAGVERHTKIVNCSGNIEAARSTRDALKLGGLEIYSEFDRLAVADATVILGKDFNEDGLDLDTRGIR